MCHPFSSSYTATYFRYFWEVVFNLVTLLQKQLLLFATGSDRIPVGGMTEMQFKITRVSNLDMWVIQTHRVLAPGNLEWNFRKAVFKLNLVIDDWGTSCEVALGWMLLDLTDDKSTLVQVMAWCRQATSHYLSQGWPRIMLLYGITRPQWVNSWAPVRCEFNFRYFIFKLISVIPEASFVKLPSYECHRTSPLIS